MSITNLTDLQNLEGRIRLEVSQHDLDEILVAVQQNFTLIVTQANLQAKFKFE